MFTEIDHMYVYLYYLKWTTVDSIVSHGICVILETEWKQHVR